MPANLFIGLWSGSYVPNGTETAATLPTLVTEVTQYDGATRKAWVPGNVSAGGVSNELSLARFSFTGMQTVNGVFVSSSSGKGSDTGALLSIVRLPVARAVDPASIWRSWRASSSSPFPEFPDPPLPDLSRPSP
ncbi:hypothetical protein [Delftia tsuruhatensis]|uniref:Uncharacterized protein n=1 Tax=Delftia tsuruhatensis TaxID=180282 RepID=A0ABN4S9I1_9BURK|nr:hypothetical protein [Delftia tsuruhatensis]AOU99852.1 hypothetical protein BI380_00005 [Delftia tsuruhatensis]